MRDPDGYIIEVGQSSQKMIDHIAFEAESRTAVDQFHGIALEVGGSCKGKPGLRPRYGDHYYAAFVPDPDGHTIEAVCRRCEPGESP